MGGRGNGGWGVSDLVIPPFFTVFQLPQMAKSLSFTRVKQVTRNYGFGLGLQGRVGTWE